MHKHGFQLWEALGQMDVELSEITPVQFGHRFNAKQGVHRVAVTVYEDKGNFLVQGVAVELKNTIQKLVQDIEAGRPIGHMAGHGDLGTVVPLLRKRRSMRL